MNYGVVPKVWKVDYEFLIKNYLDPRLWKKSWNLYTWKDFIFTICIEHIECQERAITFRIKCNKLNWDYENATYYLDNMTVDDLKRKIDGRIYTLMLSYERDQIQESEGYKQIETLIDDEKDRLTDIANKFLDDNGVTNTSIRDAYISDYVSNNTKVPTMKQNYIDYHRYNWCTELLLTYCVSINDETRIDIIKEHSHNDSIANDIMLECQEYAESMENGDFDEEFQNSLEAI